MRTDNVAMAALCGAMYGVVLTGMGFVAAGFGHGSYLPLAIFGAPVSLIPLATLFAPILVWAAIGRIIGGTRSAIWLSWLLLVHAVSVVAILNWGTPFEPGDEQWQYWRYARQHVGGMIDIGFVIYAAGQTFGWLTALRRIWLQPERSCAQGSSPHKSA